LLTSLVITASLSAAERLVGTLLSISIVVLQSMNFVFSFVVITLLFALIFKLIPDTTIPASLVVFLVWIYYSAQIPLFGAEITHAYALTYDPRLAVNF